MSKHEKTLSEIKFTITIYFKDCDVDVIFAKYVQYDPHKKRVEGKTTPTDTSVERFLYILAMHTDFGKAEVKAWNSLMMGCCSLEFVVDPSEVSFEELPAVVENCKKIIGQHMNLIGYYKENTEVGHSTGIICCG